MACYMRQRRQELTNDDDDDDDNYDNQDQPHLKDRRTRSSWSYICLLEIMNETMTL